MYLSELTLPMPHAECKDIALVYSYEVAVVLYSTQQEHGDPRHVVGGQSLTDGRYMVAGEMLAEVGDGDLFPWIREYLTQEIMAQIEVIPLADALALLPPESPSPVS
jgi:hypothetical protein